MAVTVKEDMLSGGLRSKEVAGTTVELDRTLLVEGLTTQTYAVLQEALDDTNVPQKGDTLTGNDNLYLVNRTPSIVPNSPSKVRILLEYRSFGSSWNVLPWQDGSGNDIGFLFRGSTTLQQEESRVDRFGDEIILQHTYPDDDDDFPSKTKDQGGTIRVLRPKTVLSASGTLQVSYPDVVSRGWTFFLNSTNWAGDPAGTWQCTGVSFSPQDVAPAIPLWDFEFTFEYDGTGWQPQTWFIDNRPTQNGPPINLVDGVGVKTIEWYPTRNFNDLFPI